MEALDANLAVSKTITEKFEAPRPIRAQSLPDPLARELTPGLTRENLNQHNKFVGCFERSVREDDLEPWILLPRSVTHVEYKGSIGGVLMERQHARRGNQGGYLGAAPRATMSSQMSSQIRKAEPRIKCSASDPEASYQGLLGGADLDHDEGLVDQDGRKPSQVRHEHYQSEPVKDSKNA